MKQKLFISCPASSRSGYGDHARDLIRSLNFMDRFDVKVVDQTWGNCPRTALTAEDEISTQLVTPKEVVGCDVWVQVTVPNEFQKVGRQFNIGITAGMETDRVSAEWIQGCNRMDMIIVPSQHSKLVLEQTQFDQKDDKGNTVGHLKLEKPVHVLFEGLDTIIYDKMEQSKLPITIVDTLDKIKEQFCFLSVGHWLQGDFGQDRKDVGSLILTFINTFKNMKNRPALILKTSSATFSVIDREDMLKKINSIKKHSGVHKDSIPNIYLLHGDLSPEEMNGLYNHSKVKAMVSFTHGEGFGRPLLEFSVTGKPTIATDWSGHRDFLTNYTFKIPGELKEVHPSVVWDKVILKDSKWFYANYGYASKLMKDIYKRYKDFTATSRKQRKFVKDNFNIEQMKEEFTRIVNDNIPEPVKLQLPKLKTFPKLQKEAVNE